MKKRMDRVEQAIVQLSTILVEHGERVDAGFRDLRIEVRATNERLDRLIAVTMRARTDDVERFADIERRLTRLEERVGV
jgi:hypothetical protein